MTYLIRAYLNGERALVTRLVGGILAIVHLGVTTPLKSVREGVEVVSANCVLISGYILA
jgi:hypothetical protein